MVLLKFLNYSCVIVESISMCYWALQGFDKFQGSVIFFADIHHFLSHSLLGTTDHKSNSIHTGQPGGTCPNVEIHEA